jgi:hypothetical protein
MFLIYAEVPPPTIRLLDAKQGYCHAFIDAGEKERETRHRCRRPVTLSPMTSGTYANVTIYEDHSNTSQNSIPDRPAPGR